MYGALYTNAGAGAGGGGGGGVVYCAISRALVLQWCGLGLGLTRGVRGQSQDDEFVPKSLEVHGYLVKVKLQGRAPLTGDSLSRGF